MYSPKFNVQLSGLAKAYTRYMAEGTSYNKAEYYTQAASSLQRVQDGYLKGEAAILDIIFCTLSNYESFLKTGYIPSSYEDDINVILDVVAELELTHAVRDILGMENTLIALVLTRVYMAEKGQFYSMDHTYNILTAAIGNSPPPKTLNSVRASCDFIYGKPAWDLYGLEGEQPIDVPSLLYKLNLPVAATHKKLLTRSSIEIPSDM